GAGELALALPLARLRRDFRQHVGLAQDQNLVGTDLDLASAVLAEDDLVALFEVHRDMVPVLVAGAGADGEDAAALRLLLRRVRQDDAADGGLLLFEDLHDQTVTKRLQIHAMLLTSLDVVASPIGSPLHSGPGCKSKRKCWSLGGFRARSTRP